MTGRAGLEQPGVFVQISLMNKSRDFYKFLALCRDHTDKYTIESIVLTETLLFQQIKWVTSANEICNSNNNVRFESQPGGKVLLRPHTDNTVDCSLTQASAAEAQPLLYLFISFKLKPHLLSYLPPSNVKATAVFYKLSPNLNSKSELFTGWERANHNEKG